jgi:hypothetical protein
MFATSVMYNPVRGFGGSYLHSPYEARIVGSGAQMVSYGRGAVTDPFVYPSVEFEIVDHRSGKQVTSIKFDEAVEPSKQPVRNPNGYRQRKLKARLNNME